MGTMMEADLAGKCIELDNVGPPPGARLLMLAAILIEVQQFGECGIVVDQDGILASIPLQSYNLYTSAQINL